MARPSIDRCLNCGAELHGGYCAGCGQRSVPANPTVAELTGDAWRELSGYDGRIASTFRGLLRPGHLTVEYLQGRRARYLSPVRLYLLASVVYFVAAAAAPLTTDGDADLVGPLGMNIELTDRGDGNARSMTPEERAQLIRDIDDAAWFVRPLLRAVADDPDAFRTRVFTIMPRVFFGLLPVFAAIVALFYRGRTFPTALVFAAHLHAFAFLTFALSELAKLTRQPILMGLVSVAALGVFVVYALRSFRVVYDGGWPLTMAKSVGIGVVYLLASLPAFGIILAWASLT